MNKKKIILIGIDGCDFRILKPFLSDGVLPTFSEILEEGTHGTLLSTVPPKSLPAWTSIFTGVNPGKHGVIDDVLKDDGDFQIAFGKRKVDTLWTLLNRYGLQQIIVNDPITYPPEKIKGVMLTGFSTPPGSRNFLYPEELREEVDKACDGYQPELDYDWKSLISSEKNRAFKLITKLAKKDYEATIHLAKKYDWDLLSVIFTSTDRLQHFFFNDYLLLRSHYKLLDTFVKDIINIEADINVIIVSDHGFGPLNKCFYINTWLQKQNLLSIKKSKLKRPISNLGLTYHRIVPFLLRLKLYNFFARIIPQSYARALISEQIPKRIHELIVDDKESSSFAKTNNGGLFVNDNSLLSKILTLLKSCNINGETPIQSIRLRDEVWWGPYAKNAPEIALIPKYGYQISPRLVPSILEVPEKYNELRTGIHRPEGIFMAYGPDIKKNYKLKQCLQTWDIVPTILHILDLPIPSYIDGRIFKEIFRE